ncbi:hypothetical protein [Ottowia sp. SB7-C50]|uniref:hypothetical protein n=1 Tax=Ottowia sp. SB7-C50 TaxID=3081231 RepID=UPI0029550AC7|nr:hypothetical protein [Ottowia sp. SB7-C50]WOP15445.1 hypothetical protein R0D99_16880 [Ottowia sp. SB7-C50]
MRLSHSWRRARRWALGLSSLALAGTALAASVDLTVNDTVSKAVYNYTETTAHTVTIGNRGPGTATNAVLTFNNPKSATAAVAWNTQVTCTASGGAVCPASYTLDATQAILTGTVPTLPMGAQLVLSIPAPIVTQTDCLGSPGNGGGCPPLPLVEKVVSTATITVGAGDTEVAAGTNISTANYAVNNPRIDYGLTIGNPVITPIAGTPDSLYTYTVTMRNNSTMAEHLTASFNTQFAQGTATAPPSGQQPFSNPVNPPTPNPSVTCISGTGASCANASVRTDYPSISYVNMPAGSTLTLQVSLVVGAPLCTDPTQGGKASDTRQVDLMGYIGSYVVANNTYYTSPPENTGTSADNQVTQTTQPAAAVCKSGDLLVQSIVNSGTATYNPNAPFALTASYANGAGSPDPAANVPLVFHVTWPTTGISLDAAPASCTPSGGAVCPTSWVLSADKTTLTGLAPSMPANSTLAVNFTGTTGADITTVCKAQFLFAQADIVPPGTYKDTNYNLTWPASNYQTGQQTKGNNAYQLQPVANVGVPCSANYDLEAQKSGPFKNADATVGVAALNPGDWVYFKSVVTLLPGSVPLTQYNIQDNLSYYNTVTRSGWTYSSAPWSPDRADAYAWPTTSDPGMMTAKPGDPASLPLRIQSPGQAAASSGLRCVATGGATCPDTVTGYFPGSNYWNLQAEDWKNGQPQWPAGGKLTFIYSYRVPPLTGQVTCVPSDRLSYPNNQMTVNGTPTPLGYDSTKANNTVNVPFDMVNLPVCGASASLTKTADVTTIPANGKVTYTLVLTNTSGANIDVPRLIDTFEYGGIDQGVTATISCGSPTLNAKCPTFTPLQGTRYTSNGATTAPTTVADNPNNSWSTRRPDFDFSWGTPGSNTLPAGASLTFTVTAQYPGTQTFTYNIAVARPDASANAQFAPVSANAFLNTSKSPTLVVNKDVSPKQPLPGATVTYTVDLINPNATAATGLSFSDAMDAALQAANPAGYANLACRPLTAADGQLSGAVGAATCPTFTSNAAGITGTLDLPANSGLRLTYTAIASPTGGVSAPNTASLRSSASVRGTGDGSSQANFQVLPPLPDLTSKIAPIANASSIPPGTSVTVSVTFDNVGQAAAVNAVPTLQLAPGLTGVTPSNGGNL